MEMQLLHVFRNTPFGREMLLQSAYFCKTAGISPVIYVPEHLKLLMYFDNDVVQVNLDRSYRRSRATARNHATEVFVSLGLNPPKFLIPRNFTTPSLPDIPVDFDFMTCPRNTRAISGWTGLDAAMRRIMKSARFPVLIPGAAFKPFTRIAVMFGGSANAVQAFKLGTRLGRLTNMPVELFTQENPRNRKKDLEAVLLKKGLSIELERSVANWRVFPDGDFGENLYNVPHDALVVLGAAGGGAIKPLFSRSIPGIIHSILPNSLLVVGPNYRYS